MRRLRHWRSNEKSRRLVWGGALLTAALAATTTTSLLPPAMAASGSRIIAAGPTAPVFALQVSRTNVVARVVNPLKSGYYRLSYYSGHGVGNVVATSADGKFNFIAGPGGKPYGFIIQAVDWLGNTSAPAGRDIFTSGAPDDYKTSFPLSSEVAASLAASAKEYIHGKSAQCAAIPDYARAVDRLDALAVKTANAQPIDKVQLAKWRHALASSSISEKQCKNILAIPIFIANRVSSYLSGNRREIFRIEQQWVKTSSRCYVRMFVADVDSKTTLGAVWDVLTDIRSQAECRALPQLWY